MTVTITPTLIRAARGLLDWTRVELAQRTGLSKAGVASIERGETKPHAERLEHIRAAFEEAGVVFIPGPHPGVKLKSASVEEAAILVHTTPMPAQIRAARALLGWTQLEICHRTGLTGPTLVRAEQGVFRTTNSTLSSIQRALEAAGIEFTNGGEPGVKLVNQAEAFTLW